MKHILIILILIIQCSELKINRFCDSKDQEKFIEGLILYRQFTSSEFYCSLRIRNSTTASTSSNTIQISYTNQLYSRFVGESFEITPTLSGTVTSCSITPSPPPGISISNTCTILGSSSVFGEGIEYTIIARDQLENSTKTNIKLKVMSTTAFRVYGTSGQFNTTAANSCTGGLATNGVNCLSAPRGLVFDSNENLYVADSGNNRILFFPKGSTTATRVYGQANFNIGSPNRGSTTAQNSLNTPQGISLSPSGELFIADFTNNRVVVYAKDDSSTAIRVLGQNGSYTTSTAGSTIDQFNNPGNITFDNQGNYYIALVNSHRVFYYLSGTTTPSKVYGQQTGNFSCGQLNYQTPPCNGGTISVNGLSFPISVSIDPSNSDVYIMDQLNQRILGYGSSGATLPNKLFGQVDFNTSGTSCTSNRFQGGPTDAAFDSNGNMYFTDSGSGHRVLVLQTPYTGVPIREFGQTNFTTCIGTTGTTGLNNPQWIEFDSFGNLYISDTGNNRVLVF